MVNLNETTIDYISFTGGTNQMNFTQSDTITIDGVKYKRVEDNTMVLDKTSTTKTVTYKNKTYVRFEESNYMATTEWWEMYGTGYMTKVTDVTLETELNREYNSQHTFNFVNFSLNDYPYNVGGGGTSFGR